MSITHEPKPETNPKGIIELEKPSHCLDCWFNNGDDYCVAQRDVTNEIIEHDTWAQQMAMCPIKISEQKEKTDIEKVKALFKGFSEEDYERCMDEYLWGDGTTLTIEPRTLKFDGSCDSYIKFNFDEDGKFRSLFIGGA